MTSIDYLYLKALDEIWANPSANTHANFKTCRLTKPTGAVGEVVLPYGNITLPNVVAGQRYVVVDLGQVPSSAVGIRSRLLGWVPLTTLLDTHHTLVMLFSQGRTMTLEGSYIQILNNDNLIIAIDCNNNNSTLALHAPIYVRFYTNAYYIGHAPDDNQKIKAGAFIRKTGDDYDSFVTTVNGYLGNGVGAIRIFRNGIYRPDGLPTYSGLETGDVVHYIYDPFITFVTDVSLTTLSGFQSIVDSVNKVIVSISHLEELIYVDDMEFYISGERPNGIRVGVYFPRLNPSDIRMLTYRDWSLDSPQLEASLAALSAFSEISVLLTNVRIHIFKRSNQLNVPIIHDSHFIPDLMNLPTWIRKQALTGVHSTLPLWKAENLETCAFNTFTGLTAREMSVAALPGVYSRYGAVTALERVRIKGSSYRLPIIAGSLAGRLLSFDANGLNAALTYYGSTDHTNVDLPITLTGDEVFYPTTPWGINLDTYSISGDNMPVIVSSGFDILGYYRDENNHLTVATPGLDYTTVEVDSTTTEVIWNAVLVDRPRYIRSAKHTAIHTVTVSLSEIESGLSLYGNAVTYHNEIGMYSSSLWCNGQYLIEDLDYAVHQGKAYITTEMQSADSFPTDIFSHGLVAVSPGIILCLGGISTALNGLQNQCYVGYVDHTSILWTTTTNFPVAISDMSVVLLNDGSFLVIGGNTAEGISANCYIGIPTIAANRDTPSTITWTLTTAYPVPVKNHVCQVLDDGRLLVIGGSNDITYTNVCYLGTVTETGITWVLSTNFPRSVHRHTVSKLADGRVVVIGGIGSGTSNSVYLGSVLGNAITWVRSNDYPQSIYDASSFTNANDDVIVIGGITDAGVSINNCHAGQSIGDTITWLSVASYPKVVSSQATVRLVNSNDSITLGGIDSDSSITYLDAYFGIASSTGINFVPEFHATVLIIYAGLPTLSLQHENHSTYGWIQFGNIANDGLYDLLMYRNKHFYIDGKSIPFQYIQEKEAYVDKVHNESAPLAGPYVNGRPYAIVDPVQFSRSSELDVLSASKASEEIITKMISDYLSVIDKQPKKKGIITIPQKYKLISCIMNQLVVDILNGSFDIYARGSNVDAYTTDDIQLLMAPYNSLLFVDPCLRDNNYDFLAIVPTWFPTQIAVSIDEFSFIKRVNNVLLNRKVEGLHLYFTVI